MGYTFSIGNEDFDDIANAPGQYAKGFSVSPAAGIIRYHPPGTDGNLATLMGKSGWAISVRCQIVDASPATCIFVYEFMMESWNNTYVDIVTPSGATFTRCMLDPLGMNIVAQPRATGCSPGESFIEFEATFSCDAGSFE